MSPDDAYFKMYFFIFSYPGLTSDLLFCTGFDVGEVASIMLSNNGVDD